jgi:hypothetical protein
MGKRKKYKRTNNDLHALGNTTGATSGAGTAYPFGAHEFTLGFWWGSCSSIFDSVDSVS